MKINKIWLHNENGITNLKINDTEVVNVSDYKIVGSANGKTELTFTSKERKAHLFKGEI